VGPLEIRLERLKRASSLGLDNLKRLYDRRAVVELERRSEHSLDIHFRTIGSYCATYCSRHISEIIDMVPINNVNREFMFGLTRNKHDVLIDIGKVSQGGRPITSTVRLQRLNSCHMRRIEAVEPPTVYPPPKSFFIPFDRELSAVNDEPGIESGSLENEVVERRAKVVDDFPDENAEIEIHSRLGTTCTEFLRVVWIGMKGNSVDLFLPHPSDFAYQLSKVFLCPIDPR
jgi:hypothetical protein